LKVEVGLTLNYIFNPFCLSIFDPHLGETTQHFSTQIWVKYGQTQMLG